jgi:hypothetical protein
MLLGHDSAARGRRLRPTVPEASFRTRVNSTMIWVARESGKEERIKRNLDRAEASLTIAAAIQSASSGVTPRRIATSGGRRELNRHRSPPSCPMRKSPRAAARFGAARAPTPRASNAAR